MTDRRLFAPELPEAGEQLELPAESARHARVLRLEIGAAVVLFDGQLGEADAELSVVARDRIAARVVQKRRLPPRLPALQIVLGLPKGGKLEDIARMLTELGVSDLHLARTERSVPRLDQPEQRLARIERIAIEACAQSGQPQALRIHAPAPLLEIAARAPSHAQRWVFWEEARGGFAAHGEATPHETWAVIGPEGGMSEAEVNALIALGYGVVGLGAATLRVETAAPVIAGLLLQQMGRLA